MTGYWLQEKEATVFDLRRHNYESIGIDDTLIILSFYSFVY